MYENIPQELKQINNWVCWNSKKIPINPKTGQFAKSTDSNTWGSYKQALKLSSYHNDLGIGFMIGDTDYIAIDLDDTKEEIQTFNNGDKDNIVGEFIEGLKSYSEISPSGNGIHIWVKGDIKLEGNRKGKVEMYDKSSPRYLTFTGNVLGPYKNISKNDEVLKKLYEKYIDKKKVVTPVQTQEHVELDLSENEIIEKIRDSKQGNLFNELYNGNWEGNYSSQSEADLAFANMLAFWTQKDYFKMDNIFRSSGLMREKWNEKRGTKTYGKIILDKAIEDTKEVYQPKKRDDYSIFIKEETNTTNNNGIIKEINNCYFKTDKGYPIQISTFIINLKEIINNDLDGEMYYKADFISNGYSEEITFKAKDFNNKNKFMDLLEHPNFIFTGSQNDLQEIKKILAMQPYKSLKGVSYIGFHREKNKRIFITQDKAIDENFKEVKNITIDEENQVVKTNILNYKELTKEELKELSPHLFNFNELRITSSLISMLPILFMKPLLIKKGVKTQHIVIYGEAGAGKSQTAETIIEPFFSIDKNNTLSCSNVTQFSLLKSLSNSNAIPVILEEYKPSFLSDTQRRLISDSLRNTYDCHTATRGTRNQQLINYTMLAPIVLIGEEGQEETAIKERSIILNFNKQGRKGKEESFYFLKYNSNLLNKLGRTILNRIMKANIDELIERRRQLMEKFISENITEDRVREAVGNILLGFTIIADLYKEYEIHFEEVAGVKIVDVIDAINSNTFTEVLDESSNTKSIVDNTIELLGSMEETDVIFHNKDYVFVNNNSELALNITSLYPKLTKYVREYNVSTEIITSQRQFTKQLRKTSYFIDYKNVKFNGISKKAYVLDIKTLEDKNINIQPLYRIE